MKDIDPLKFGLADFGWNDNPDVLAPPEDFQAWAAVPDIKLGMSLYEQPLQASPTPRTSIQNNFDGQIRDIINLTSYNYLGLSTHPEVLAAAKEATDKYGLGASGAAMLSGTFDLHEQFAAALAKFKHKDAAMLFSSGLGGNIGAIQGLLRKGDVLVIDAKCHRSIIDGAKLAGATLASFAHNDAESLDAVLSKHAGKRRLIVVEGVYSMDGDLCDLPPIVEVAKTHNVPIYCDEAHSTLLFGETGSGVAEHFGLEDAIGISFGTLSKSFGGVGGFVCANQSIIDYIKYYASPFQFSCALPPPIVAGMMKSLEIGTTDTSMREKLWENVKYFRENLDTLNLDTGLSQSQIIPIIVGSDGRQLYSMAVECQRRGLFLQPVDFPAVEAHTRRFRISVSSQLTKADIDEACTIIEDVIAKPLGTI
ncbi:aminotransferase class I/II-fold pyridoxal phosphate-dependent enzyme [Bradymonas sediminis]|uniref:8-amino-7-oxononanoate synthase n=1 Tax=Bradymonas sediminis TaxID=1548548 RepID=A0A2Z4FGE9_9DELT|nr:aminotransferase class I/II-fold pyridoxal phosphate-dependent enzyme [Bradymonas sediminis]AWV88009.1 8-amino-7-oxononanoate synthase [Bradymonas sediminis]TDP77132.1 2-amino-3-ketobutyrate coenzyme A ligase [Bradymonas sediminis]